MAKVTRGAGAAAIGAEGIAKKEDKCELINGM